MGKAIHATGLEKLEQSTSRTAREETITALTAQKADKDNASKEQPKKDE